MTDQQTITEFLEKRLREDEAAAREALEADQQMPGFAEHECFRNETWQRWSSGDRVRVVSHCGCSTTVNADDRPDAERTRMAGRVLREVEAKRAIIKDHLEDHVPEHDCAEHLRSLWPKHSGCYVIGQLAAVYSDHEDFREEWRT